MQNQEQVGTTVYDGLSVNLSPAPIGKRIFAYCVDLAVVSLGLYLLFIVFLLAVGGSVALGAMFKSFMNENPIAAIILAVFLLLLFFSAFALIFHGYFVFFEHKKGSTPGKKLFGIWVVSLKGNRLTMGQCVLRDMMRYLDCMLVFPGLISICASQRRQRLGDMLASTLVVYSPRKEAKSGFLYLTQTEFDYMKEALQPKPVPVSVATEYLKFAYSEFISYSRRVDALAYTQWDAVLGEYLPGVSSQNFQKRELLLFLAEWCSQSLNVRR